MQGQTRKSGAAADVDHPLATRPGAHGNGGERIQEMFCRDLRGRCDRGEVHRRIAFDEEIGIPRTERDRRGIEPYADTLGVTSERLEWTGGDLAGRHGP